MSIHVAVDAAAEPIIFLRPVQSKRDGERGGERETGNHTTSLDSLYRYIQIYSSHLANRFDVRLTFNQELTYSAYLYDISSSFNYAATAERSQ